MECLGASTEELVALAVGIGEPRYRGRQLAEWIYRKSAASFADMTDLPAKLREKLASSASLTRAEIVTRSDSGDETSKFLLSMADGERIESVLIPYADRVTVCVSTQVGCAAGCEFCATATDGFVRNLSAGEIVDQVLTLQSESGRRVTNVVFMGMGEPLLNWDAVVKAVHLLNEEVGIAMRKITISTVGITPRIRMLQELNLQLTLAISLHAPDEELRRRLIPLASRYPLMALIGACRDYASATGRRVTYEYLLLDGVNDSPTHAERLASLLKGSLAAVNLIPYNKVAGKSFRRPPNATIDAFRSVLESHGIETTQRFERGHSVAGACGQLRSGISGK